MIHNDFERGYERLLEMSGKSPMKIKRIKQLTTEMFKTADNLNPNFMKNKTIGN